MLAPAVALWLVATPCLCRLFSDDSSEFGFLTIGFKAVFFYDETEVRLKAPYPDKITLDKTDGIEKQCQYIDYHWAKKTVFLTTASDTIYMIQPRKNPQVTHVEIKGANKGIAIDWVNDKIFLEVCGIDKARCAIEMYDFQWKRIGKVTGIEGTVNRLEIDPYERVILLLSDERKEIMTIDCDSTEKRIILKEEIEDDTYADVTLDLAARRVFFIVQCAEFYRPDRLESTDYSGRDRTTHATLVEKNIYYGMNVFQNSVYWLAIESTGETGVYKIQLNDSNSVQQLVFSHPEGGFHMRIIHHELQRDPAFLTTKTLEVPVTHTSETDRETTTMTSSSTTTTKTTTATATTTTTSTSTVRPSSAVADTSPLWFPAWDKPSTLESQTTTSEIITEASTTSTPTTTKTTAQLSTTTQSTTLHIGLTSIPSREQEPASPDNI